MKIVIAGFGYIGRETARRLADRGHEVVGLRRTPSSELLSYVDVRAADVCDLDSIRRNVPARTDALVYAASPSSRSDLGYENVYVKGLQNALRACRPNRLVVLGSTGVAEFFDGRWIDEYTPIRPDRFTARRLAQGEALTRAAGGTVLRLGGIYGPGRERLLRETIAGRQHIPESPLFTNRIHRDDAAEIIVHTLGLERPADCYFACDHEPADFADVVRFIASEAGVAGPTIGPHKRRAHKRCRNARLVRSGYRFLYPTYREGYRALLGEK